MQTVKKRIENARRPVRQGKLVTVGRVSDVPSGRGATVELSDGSQVALYNIEGCFYAIENFCPHRGAPLADGRLCGNTVTCDLHNWRFDVITGACLGRMEASVETYPVTIENEMIKILI
jgi:nitrite reductase/ring-hydroxylating ferredoxin subunit